MNTTTDTPPSLGGIDFTRVIERSRPITLLRGRLDAILLKTNTLDSLDFTVFQHSHFTVQIQNLNK